MAGFSFRKVRLVNSRKYPRHNISAAPSAGKWAEWRGKEIVVGSAEKPSTQWNCNTQEVYMVSSDTLREVGIAPEFFGMIFVCQHQIQEPAHAD
jgi:hypothetical protein